MDEGTPRFRYDARLANEIELRWQDRWEREGTFHAPNRVAGRPKFYLVDFFPYPSGIGLHVGHPLGYIGTDVFGRYLRMTGHHVLHPFGFDTFGLPAEQYAIDTGQHPAVTVRQNAAVMRRQLRRLGLGHDRRREIMTSDPSFYRWTQWIFLQIFNSWYDPAAGPPGSRGRARPVSELVAEFASGQRPVPGGRAWAGLSAAEQRDIVDDHRLAYQAEQIVNWCPGLGTVLADEEVTDEGRSAVGNYPVYRRPLRQWLLRITAFAERLLADLDGVDWPENVKRLQRNWIGPSGGPYRLRDWLFSRQRYWGEPFPIVYDEADPARPIALPAEMLPVTLPDVTDFRPLPQDDASDPVPALARAIEWSQVTLDLGDGPKRYRRELNVMPQWAGSSWYYLRYLDPRNQEALVDPDIERYWMRPGGVDLYVGGVEHAVLHLLYARFWHKVLYDIGVASTVEPFGRLFNQGYILADAFTDARGQYVPAAEVTHVNNGWAYRGQPVTRRAGKMGKSLKNGVSPDEINTSYGADTLRLYEMAMGPLDADRPWRADDIVGMHRFLQRLWRLIVDESTGETLPSPDGQEPLDAATTRLLHQTIIAVRDDFAALRFNTAIARIIELTAHASRLDHLPRALAEPLVLMVAPLAPHVAEELWQRLGHPASLAYEPFPQPDPALAAEPTVTLPVQVNGKRRFTIEVPATAGEAEIADLLAQHPSYPQHDVARVVIVPGKIVNVVLRLACGVPLHSWSRHRVLEVLQDLQQGWVRHPGPVLGEQPVAGTIADRELQLVSLRGGAPAHGPVQQPPAPVHVCLPGPGQEVVKPCPEIPV
jgi:leucyl-tRNA synthetase